MEQKNKPKCVVVLSGGQDSAVVAYWSKKEGYELYPITFNYGQIAVKETNAAQKIAASLCTTTKIVDLSALKGVFGDVTSLCNTNIPLTSEFSQPIIVPFRNAIFLSVAVSRGFSWRRKNLLWRTRLRRALLPRLPTRIL